MTHVKVKNMSINLQIRYAQSLYNFVVFQLEKWLSLTCWKISKKILEFMKSSDYDQNICKISKWFIYVNNIVGGIAFERLPLSTQFHTIWAAKMTMFIMLINYQTMGGFRKFRFLVLKVFHRVSYKPPSWSIWPNVSNCFSMGVRTRTSTETNSHWWFSRVERWTPCSPSPRLEQSKQIVKGVALTR